MTNGCFLDLPRVGPAVGVPRTPGRVQRHCGTLWACVPASGVADTASGGRDRDNSAMTSWKISENNGFSLFSTLLLKLTRNRIDPSLCRLIYWTLNAPMDTKIGEKYASDTKYCVN